MWYDLLVLGILVFFTLRGAAKGVVWQLAGIAGIILCLVFSQGISATVGPYISIAPPLNHWVAMFAAYLFFSFIAFGFARVLNDWIEKASLEYFNRHLGALFGFLKGAVLCIIMTYFVITLSPKAREALQESKSGYYSAVIMHRLHPIIPDKLHDKVEEYIAMFGFEPHSLADEEAHRAANGGKDMPPIIDLGGAIGWPASPGTSGTQTGGTTDPIQQFLQQLPSSVSANLKAAIGRALETTPPSQRSQVAQQLVAVLQQARPQDYPALEQQLLNSSGPSLSNMLAGWMNQYWTMPSPAPQPTTPAAPTAPAFPSTNTPAYPNSLPPFPSQTAPAYPQPQSPTYPAPAYPAAPPATVGGSALTRAQLLQEISRRFSSIPPIQQQVQADIERRMTGLPEPVSLAVLQDWYCDLTGSAAADPDPGTNANTTLEVRIVRQLQARGIPVNRLSSELQQSLDGATLR